MKFPSENIEINLKLIFWIRILNRTKKIKYKQLRLHFKNQLKHGAKKYQIIYLIN